MTSRLLFDLLKFTSSDAERICGAPQASQWNWRRAGYLRQFDGHPRYDIVDLAELWVMSNLAKQGVGPGVSSKFARVAGLSITWWALRLISAYERDHLNAPRSKFALKNAASWEAQSLWLAEHILSEEEGKDDPADLFAVWPDGSFGPLLALHEADPAFSEKENRGTFVLIPARAAARWMLEEIGGPIVRVSARNKNQSKGKHRILPEEQDAERRGT